MRQLIIALACVPMSDVIQAFATITDYFEKIRIDELK
jgi:hypothetical protein